jgi:hypothetical protein
MAASDPIMTSRDDDFNPRPGRIHHGNQGAKRPKSFVGEVMRAAKKAGHRGQTFSQSNRTAGRSTFGRGRRAALSLASRSSGRRVVVMARIVRHRGARFRSAPLSKHVAYLKRDGVTRDGADARMFDAASDDSDTKAFVERCEEDRHHFRLTVSPEDAGQLADLRAFTRELMKDAERDLGTGLDWVAVDHWNTDNPHVHVLVRGRADDGQDLVVSRDYISKGFRARARAPVDAVDDGVSRALQLVVQAAPVDARPCRQARAARVGRTSRLGAVDLEARPRAGPTVSGSLRMNAMTAPSAASAASITSAPPTAARS